ncbi:uncharacterized protein BJ212DRAFT_1397315 [Suillus subaureus]|uniref:Uncharacterized protein n=1 Tax=Suillus subaureus TaxID=48587 RepID=A0A9P7DTG5_9AGAM|nr:uncharacterized protein BJ212DRAFT_1397315 [Suillus subaureus]KAG1802544.1 hypothetical protein BJ212DRAFT_1397315 [Suillus subaureus]
MDALTSTGAERLFRALSHFKQTLEQLTIFEQLHISFPSHSSGVCDSDCDSGTCIYLDNNLLLEAMSAWPHIHTLKIENCGIRPSPIQHTSLQTLHMETPRSHIGNAEVIARIVFNWLPCVDQVNKGVDDWAPWYEINEHLVSSRAVAPHATGAASNTCIQWDVFTFGEHLELLHLFVFVRVGMVVLTMVAIVFSPLTAELMHYVGFHAFLLWSSPPTRINHSIHGKLPNRFTSLSA